MAAPMILVEAQPRRVADGVAEIVRLAGGGGARPYHYAGQHYRAGIDALPTVIGSLNYDGEIIGGGITEALTISWSPAGHAGIDVLAPYVWRDADITVRVGPEGAMPPVLSQGKVTDVATGEGKMAIAMADPAADVMKPLPASYYAGTGDLEGPADWEKKIKRRLWGRIFNREAEPLDKANNIYCLSDPTRPIQAILEVRESGAPVTITLLAWQGSAVATLAALRAIAVPDGEAIVCPSISCIKFWNQPAVLHADLLGEVGTGYVETAPEIAERLVQALGGPAFAAGAVTDAKLLRPAPMGWAVEDETTTVAAMLDEMLANVSLMWMPEPTGEIVMRAWAWGASVASAVSQDVARKKSFAPVTTRKLGYRRNESVMARGDLAAIVLATDLSYLDGTPIEDLKPAEPGSDITSAIIGVAEIRIAAEFGGTVSESLPRLQAFRLIRNSADVTDASSWTVTVQSGTLDASIGTDGVLSLDTAAGTLTNSVLLIEATYNDRTYQTTVRVTKALSLPPSGGTESASGGFSATVNASVMAAVSREISVEVAASGNATLSANYSFTVDNSFGEFTVLAQWYRWNGTAYVAIGVEQESTDPALGGRPSIGEPGEPGYGGCNFADTGLTPASLQKYRLYMRSGSGTATRPRVISGSYSVVSS